MTKLTWEKLKSSSSNRVLEMMRLIRELQKHDGIIVPTKDAIENLRDQIQMGEMETKLSESKTKSLIDKYNLSDFVITQRG